MLRITHGIPLWGKKEAWRLDMPRSQHGEIVGKFDGEEAKRQLFIAWLANHPCPSWEHLRNVLRLGVGGEKGARAADEVEQTYLKSESLM